MMEKKKNISFCLLVITCCIAMYPRSGAAQCPVSDNALSWGYGALSLFYANSYLQVDRQQMGVSDNDLSQSDIEPITDDSLCTQLENHIMGSGDFPQERKDQSKVYFKHEQTNRYFVIFYTEPAQPGWNTFVYVLDENFNKLGAFGV